jgi:arsenate reductase (thioredoxin)
MAEGFFRKYAPEGYEPMSAGTKPTSQINPVVVQAMGKIGVDIKQQKPKDIFLNRHWIFNHQIC